VPTTLPSLYTPLSKYKRHVRYYVLEFDPLLDSSSMNPEHAPRWAHFRKELLGPRHTWEELDSPNWKKEGDDELHDTIELFSHFAFQNL